LAREALAGLAEALSLSREQYDDVRTAVTEACNNVVQHAYPSGVGPLEIDVSLLQDALEVVVRDHGVGMASAAEHAGDLEIGLPVMLALCERVQIAHLPEGGTEAQMRFGVPGMDAVTACCEHDLADLDLPGSLPLLARATFSNGDEGKLASAILRRVATALAVRAHFGTDGVSDVQLVSDVLARDASPLGHGGCLHVGLATTPGRLDLRVGPLVQAGAERLLSGGVARLSPAGAPAPSLPILDRLAQVHGTVSVGEGEVLLLKVLDRGR
jgi:serine/threonine-protein kinase RsbW